MPPVRRGSNVLRDALGNQIMARLLIKNITKYGYVLDIDKGRHQAELTNDLPGIRAGRIGCASGIRKLRTGLVRASALFERGEACLRLPGQSGSHDAIGLGQTVAQFLLRSLRRKVDPGTVEIGCPAADTKLNQQLRRFDAVSLDRNPGRRLTHARKHPAADLPGVMPVAPGVGDLGTGEGTANFIHPFPAHADPQSLVCMHPCLLEFGKLAIDSVPFGDRRNPDWQAAMRADENWTPGSAVFGELFRSHRV